MSIKFQIKPGYEADEGERVWSTETTIMTDYDNPNHVVLGETIVVVGHSASDDKVGMVYSLDGGVTWSEIKTVVTGVTTPQTPGLAIELVG